MNRGGLLKAVDRSRRRAEAYASIEDGGGAIVVPHGEDDDEPAYSAGYAGGRGVLSTGEAMDLLGLYLTAIVHDFGHLGLTNACMIQTSHPLAVGHTD